MNSSSSSDETRHDEVTTADARPADLAAAHQDIDGAAVAPAEGASDASPGMSYSECDQRLKTLFPALFVGAAKPLKLRIQVDIQERSQGVFSKRTLSAFFRRYTGSTAYLLAVSKSKFRFDLDGQPAGELSDEHRQAALDELARRRANSQARREREAQERLARASLWRKFQSTTLTRANFCALNGIEPDALDELLAQAESEAKEMASRPPPRPRQTRQPERPQRAHRSEFPPRRDGRGPR